MNIKPTKTHHKLHLKENTKEKLPKEKHKSERKKKSETNPKEEKPTRALITIYEESSRIWS